MLGGGEKPLITQGRGVCRRSTAPPPRLFAAVELLRRYPEAQLIYSGGSGDPLAPEPSEAGTVKVVLQQLGADLSRVRFRGYLAQYLGKTRSIRWPWPRPKTGPALGAG
ncbi:MAG: hypothetical protein WDN69_11320 [Aliidongia sp.]